MGLLAFPAPFTRRAPRVSGEYTPLPRSPVPSSSSSTASWDSDGSALLEAELAFATSQRDDDLNLEPLSRGGGARIPAPLRDPALLVPALIFIAGVTTLFIAFPFPTTVHAFIPLALALASWVTLSWLKLGWGALRAWRRHGPAAKTMAEVMPVGAGGRRRSVTHITALLTCTALVGYWLGLGLVPPKQHIPALAPIEDSPRYFIAANLYNNEHLLPRWSREIHKLAVQRESRRQFLVVGCSGKARRRNSTTCVLCGAHMDPSRASHCTMLLGDCRFRSDGGVKGRLAFVRARSRPYPPIHPSIIPALS